jgi:hypothetical protein
MLALRAYPAVAGAVSSLRVAYAGLSSGCHHHPYELPPTRAELDGLIAAVERFAVTVAQAVVQPPPAAAKAPPREPLKPKR